MTQEERRRWLIDYLLRERPDGGRVAVPGDARAQERLLRALMNLRPAAPIDGAFLTVQDAYLQEALAARRVTRTESLRPVEPGIYLWQGDITALAADAIVNAANPALLGCFVPCHGCIDNAIHSAAGVQLRLACAEIVARQGGEEEVGRAKLTLGYNLPSKYVIHTVGPVVTGPVARRDCELLARCYRACLTLAQARGLKNLAFCCISTGEYRFPNERAARVAIDAVRAYRSAHAGAPEVIFNVYKDVDFEIYRRLLGEA